MSFMTCNCSKEKLLFCSLECMLTKEDSSCTARDSYLRTQQAISKVSFWVKEARNFNQKSVMNKKEFEKNGENFDAIKKEIKDLQKMIMEFAEEADYTDFLSQERKIL